jgi:hypothetical protein
MANPPRFHVGPSDQAAIQKNWDLIALLASTVVLLTTEHIPYIFGALLFGRWLGCPLLLVFRNGRRAIPQSYPADGVNK